MSEDNNNKKDLEEFFNQSYHLEQYEILTSISTQHQVVREIEDKLISEISQHPNFDNLAKDFTDYDILIEEAVRGDKDKFLYIHHNELLNPEIKQLISELRDAREKLEEMCEKQGILYNAS